MRRVIVESPYAGNVRINITYATACMRDCLLRGEAPLASHILYASTDVLDDNKPGDRRRGMNAGFAWGEVADATVVYTDLGVSPGMAEGIAHAFKCGRPVEYRALQRWHGVEAMPIRLIADAVCDAFNVSLADMTGPERGHWITKPRHAAMAFAREFSTASLPQIGNFFHRHHTSVIHGIDRLPYWLRDESFLRPYTVARTEIEGMFQTQAEAA